MVGHGLRHHTGIVLDRHDPRDERVSYVQCHLSDPGSIDWSERFLRGHGAPEETALVAVLLSPSSSCVNGIDIAVDGGLVAGRMVRAIALRRFQ